MKVKASERQAILQSLRSGVVPRTGLRHILVGRQPELDQIMKDVATVAQGGSTMRFVIGNYGAGKTFFLNLVKLVALEKGLVVMNADVSSDRRLQGGDGQAVNLYSELLRNLSTRTRSDGGALKSVIERFIMTAVEEAEKTERSTREVIRRKLDDLSELVAGFDFADVLNTYYEGYEAQDEERQRAALKWLRGEFAGKMEARKALGVRTMVDDDSVYDYLKLWARFATLAGYGGLLVSLDEMASIHSLSSSQARQQNFDQLLRILNDINQGSAEHLALMLGGTFEFLEDERRGLYSHEALRTRLAPNEFAHGGLVDFAHPVMRLSQLTQDDLLALLSKVRSVHAHGLNPPCAVSDADLTEFIKLRLSKIGHASFLTPRETVKDFIQILSVLEQNPGAKFDSVLRRDRAANVTHHQTSKDAELADLESFRL